MSLTRQEVEHIAELAKLGLTEEEKEQFRNQLSAILDYAQMLQQLDTDDVSPTAHAMGLHNVLRPDEVAPSLPQDQILANAPDQAAGYFRVKAVLE